MATDIDKLFQDADAAEVQDKTGTDGPPAETNGAAKAPTDLAAKVAAKRGKGAAPSPTPSTAPAAEPALSDNGLTTQANDELAKLAAKNEVKAGKGKGTARASASPAADAPDTTSADAGTQIPTEIPGLTSTPADGATPNAFEVRQAELAAARARSGGGKKKMSAAEKRAADKAKAKDAAAKAKEKAKEKTQKQKDAEKARADKKKAESAERKKKEDERKAKIEADKRERAAIRASKATPDLLKKMPKQVQELFAVHYKAALEDKIRRPKCDRGDFCAGWLTLLTFFRKSGVQMPTAKPAPAEKES